MDDIDILDLLLKEHYGLINDQERQKLNEILAASEEARAMQRDVQAIPEEEARSLMNKVNIADSYDDIMKRDRRYRFRKTATRLAVAAAVAGLIATGIWWGKTPAGTQTSLHAQTGYSRQITLRLADGQLIELKDSGSQAITAGNASLQNNNRTLQFSSLASKGEAHVGWNTLTVPVKLDYQVRLSDGTTVWLNSTTTMRFPFSFNGNSREVYIDGEAYFKIAPDAKKPFIVHSGNNSIRVLGTEFNVNSYKKGTVVTSLVQGKVAVSVGDERIELQPGKETISSGNAIKVDEFDAGTTLGWRQGIHYFRDASMSEIAEMVARYFDVKMVIDNEQTAKERLRGKLFRHQPLQNFVEVVNAIGRVELYWKNSELHCRKK